MAQSSSMPTLYIDIEQPSDRGDFIIQVIDPVKDKVICTNKLPETQSSINYLYTTKLIERPQDALNNDPSSDAKATHKSLRSQQRYDDIVRYGQRLYKDIFGNGKSFKKYIKRQDHLSDRIKFVLRLHNTASELWNIPWEYVHDGDKFLSVDAGFPFLRQPQSLVQEATKAPLSTLPVRILVVISDPIDATPLNIDHEITIIKDSLEEAEAKGLVNVDYVEEGSLYNLDIMLHENDYHILHYTGHGAMTAHGSCLLMEDENGRAEPVFIQQLLPIIQERGTLRLVVLSGCQTGQIDETQAMSGIATGLLQAVPAVVSMQFSVLDVSAQIFAQAFYGTIGKGATLEDAIHASRLAMNKKNSRLADWGVPSLYTLHESLRLLDPKAVAPPTTKVATTIDLSALPTPITFIGRRDEQRQIRRALPNLSIKMAYIWGLGGMGKSALARRIIERPGRADLISGALILRADTTPPNEMLLQFTQWLEQYFPDATAPLKNSKLSPAQRIQAIAPQIQQKRLVLVIDRFDALLQETPNRQWGIPAPAIAQFFYQLATADWSIMTIFTSRYRWRFLSKLSAHTFTDIHLNEFGISNLQHMMHQLPNLQSARWQHMQSLFGHIGGHPQSIVSTEALVGKYKRTAIIADDKFITMLAKDWHDTFMQDTMARLNSVERTTLLMASVLGDYFSPAEVQYIANLKTREQAELCMARWEALSLANFVTVTESDTPYYHIPTLVRTYMMRQLKEGVLPQLHQRVVDMMIETWYQTAVIRYQENGGTAPNPDDQFTTALTELQKVIEYSNPQFAPHYINLGLRLRTHLIGAGDNYRAEDIAFKWWFFVARMLNDNDSAKQLLNETIASVKSDYDRALARMYLAELLLDDGKYDEALKIFTEIEPVLIENNDTSNRLRMMKKKAWTYETTGDSKRAKKIRVATLELCVEQERWREASNIYIDMGQKAVADEKFKDALNYATKAEQLLKRETNVSAATIGNVIYLRGNIFKQQNNLRDAYEAFSAALQYFQQAGATRSVADTLGDISSMLYRLGNLEEAARLILQAIGIAEELNDSFGLTGHLLLFSLILEEKGSLEEALVQVERAMVHAETARPNAIENCQRVMKRQRRKTGKSLF